MSEIKKRGRGRPKGSKNKKGVMKNRPTTSDKLRQKMKEEEEFADKVMFDITPATPVEVATSPVDNIVRDNKGRVTVGSKGLNNKFTLQQIEERFMLAAEAAYRGEILSVEEAMIAAGLFPSTWYRYCREYPHLKEIAEAIKSGMKAFVTRQAFNNQVNPLFAIFKLKVWGDIEAGKLQDSQEDSKEQPIINLEDFQ